MKIIFPILLLLLGACTSKERKERPVYEVINDVWVKNGSIEDLKNKFGNPDHMKGKIAEYMFPNSKVPKMHFQFNEEGKLETALLFLDQIQLHEFKNLIGCEWVEKTGEKQIADYIDKTHEGQCKGKPIRFSYFSSLNSYQVWWDKK